MTDICKIEDCTGCQACVYACPKQCIQMKNDEFGMEYPFIDSSQCIRCALCQKTCPVKNIRSLNTPLKVYAGWSKDESTRRLSASGGISTELYKKVNAIGGYAVGVQLNEDNEAKYIQIKLEEDICKTRNSKYVYSSIGKEYQNIKNIVTKGDTALFIGLPCQIAGLKSYLKRDYDNLYCVDLICHGIAPSLYLKQHISNLERKHKKKATTISFRDPQFGTKNYSFTLRDNDSLFYKTEGLGCDEYQLGYHLSLIYRDCCYACKYAQRQRIGDITLGDFTGLGRIEPFEMSKDNVNCILVNSKKGERLLDVLADSIELHERPKEEAFEFESQLNHPYSPHPQREKFKADFLMTRDFDTAAKHALQKEILAFRSKHNILLRIYKKLIKIISKQ